MASTSADLLRDPLFQTNLVLWLAQPLPIGTDIDPILFRKGFSVSAIAPMYPLPPATRLQAESSGVRLKDGARPDVVLTNEARAAYVMVECKGNSFGTESSSSVQARTMLLLAGPQGADVLGASPDKRLQLLLTYLTTEDCRRAMMATLEELAEELQLSHFEPGPADTLGLRFEEGALLLAVGEPAAGLFSLSAGDFVVARCSSVAEVRPLYFIPYDPDVDQCEEERAFCKRVLFERIQSAVVAAIGRCTPPTEVEVTIPQLLNDATFGTYGLWQNRESARNMRDVCRQLATPLFAAVNKAAKGSVENRSATSWCLTVKDPDQQDGILDALTTFSVAELDLGIPASGSLFDRN